MVLTATECKFTAVREVGCAFLLLSLLGKGASQKILALERCCLLLYKPLIQLLTHVQFFEIGFHIFNKKWKTDPGDLLS